MNTDFYVLAQMETNNTWLQIIIYIDVTHWTKKIKAFFSYQDEILFYRISSYLFLVSHHTCDFVIKVDLIFQLTNFFFEITEFSFGFFLAQSTILFLSRQLFKNIISVCCKKRQQKMLILCGI